MTGPPLHIWSAFSRAPQGQGRLFLWAGRAREAIASGSGGLSKFWNLKQSPAVRDGCWRRYHPVALDDTKLYGFQLITSHRYGPSTSLRVACPELVEGLRANGNPPFVLSVAAAAAESKHTGMDRHHVESVLPCAKVCGDVSLPRPPCLQSQVG